VSDLASHLDFDLADGEMPPVAVLSKGSQLTNFCDVSR